MNWILPTLVASGILALSVESSMAQDVSIVVKDSSARQEAAARAFADALWPPSSAEYATSLRIGLASAATALPLHHEADSNGRGARAASLPTPSSLDHDPRYRSNLLALTNSREPKEPGSERIWGGMQTSGYSPAVAVMGRKFICSGVLISPTKVLTAAHCLCKGDKVQQIHFGPLSRRPISAIPIDAKATRNRAGCPPSFQEGDVALLSLRRAAPANVTPVNLASTSELDAAVFLRLVGYGQDESRFVGRKMVVDAPIATSKCDGAVMAGNRPFSDEAYYGCSHSKELVAGEVGSGIDTCSGDSGGPALLVPTETSANPADTTRPLTLAAVTSRRVRMGKGCGDGGIYVRVDGIVGDWIRQHAGLH